LLLEQRPYPDLSEVQGQTAAKRALLVAAAGGHNLLFTGPPGTGKTLLASRLPGLLPPLDEREALEVAAIRSVSGHAPLDSWPQRPFRHPHHSASGPALVGGGSRPQPGEITLAHHGVLFLDELPEFERRVLEVLREPLESGEIVIARARDGCASRHASVGGGDEPLPLRLLWRPHRPLPLQPRADPALPQQTLRPPARPHRPAPDGGPGEYRAR
jgi:magnesium chelatase family protein